MKIKLYFVSNSSSSSFICDTCGETFSGWDISPSEEDHTRFYRTCNHTVCNQELLPSSLDPEHEDYDTAYDKTRCPICNWKFISQTMRDQYIYKLFKIEKEKEIKNKNHSLNYLIDQEIRSKFKSYKEFEQFIKLSS